jgi:NADPH:quinone reductase-like Zn-dependent oxidoreductase
MKAVIFRRHGGAEVLEYQDVAEPRLHANEVLVEVRACALNHLDVWVRKGLPGIEIPLPHILGNDIAGVVREVGEVVDWVRAGDEVLLQPGVSCGHCAECLRGQDNLCANYDILGYRRDGGYAQFVTAPAVNVIPKPQNLSWEEAASCRL